MLSGYLYSIPCSKLSSMYWTVLQLLFGILKCWLSSGAEFRMLIISFCCSTPSLITNGESSSLSLHDTSRTEHFFTLEWLIHLKTLLLMDLKVFKNLEWTGSTVVRQTGMAGFKCHAKTRKEFCFLTFLRPCMKWERKAQVSLFLTGNENMTLFSCLTGNGLSTELKEFWTEHRLLKLHHLF